MTPSRHSPALPSRHAQRGVSLIEVLVAVLILGIGLLGIAALQASALRNSQGSFARSQAVVETYGILDAMRANRAAAVAGTYNRAMPAAGAACPSPTAATLVAADQARWLDSLRNNMGDPNACGSINCVAEAGTSTTACTVVVRWDDSRGTGGSAIQTLDSVSRL